MDPTLERMAPAADVTVLGFLALLADPGLWMQVAVVLVAFARLVELLRSMWLARKAAAAQGGE